MTARIYPTDGPRDFEDSSHEDEIYYALRDRLSEDYIVIHSFKYRKKFNRGFEERESDFVVYHWEFCASRPRPAGISYIAIPSGSTTAEEPSSTTTHTTRPLTLCTE